MPVTVETPKTINYPPEADLTAKETDEEAGREIRRKMRRKRTRIIKRHVLVEKVRRFFRASSGQWVLPWAPFSIDDLCAVQVYKLNKELKRKGLDPVKF